MKKQIRLNCCGASQEVSLLPGAIVAREPNEVRKNVTCQKCHKLVILAFDGRGGEISCIEQEIIDLDEEGGL